MTVLGKHALFINLEKTNLGYWKFSRIIFFAPPPPTPPALHINPMLNNAFALLEIKLHNKSQTNKFKIQKFLTFFFLVCKNVRNVRDDGWDKLVIPVRQRIRNLFHFHIRSHSVAVCVRRNIYFPVNETNGKKSNGCVMSTFPCTAILGAVANRDVARRKDRSRGSLGRGEVGAKR